MSGKIAVLGCGTMAGALVGGLIDAGQIKAEDVVGPRDRRPIATKSPTLWV